MERSPSIAWDAEGVQDGKVLKSREVFSVWHNVFSNEFGESFKGESFNVVELEEENEDFIKHRAV